jgi:hypothetical protein
MRKEKYYNIIKKYIYRKFDVLEVVKRNDGNTLYLRYKNNEYAEIIINKKFGEVYYYSEYKKKICYMIGINQVDFEILLKSWVEETFQMKVSYTSGSFGVNWLVR